MNAMRTRLGMLTPSSNSVLEPVTYAMLADAPGTSAHFSRFRVTEIALDAQTKLEMQEELVAIWQKHRCTIVFVTHSVDEALVLGNKIVVMTRRPGRIRDSITFDLPRPRDITGPEFNDAKRRVLALIREESARNAQVA